MLAPHPPTRGGLAPPPTGNPGSIPRCACYLAQQNSYFLHFSILIINPVFAILFLTHRSAYGFASSNTKLNRCFGLLCISIG